MRIPCAPCTPAPDTVLLHCRRTRPCTVAPCRLTVRLRRSSGTRNAWWFPSLRRSSGPLTSWRRRRLRADGAARTAVSRSARWRRAAACSPLPVRAEPREPRHAVVVELSLDGDVRTTMAGADYSRGPLTVGLGASTLSLTPDGASALETNVSMMTSAVGTRGEPVGSRATARPRRRASDARSVRWRRRSSMRWRAGGAQLADRRTARGKGRAGGGVRLGPRGPGRFAIRAARIRPARLRRSADLPHLAALPFDQLRPLRALVGHRTGG